MARTELFTVILDDGLLDVEWKQRVAANLMNKIWHVIKVKYRLNKRMLRRDQQQLTKHAEDERTAPDARTGKESDSNNGRAAGEVGTAASTVDRTGTGTPGDLGRPGYESPANIEAARKEAESGGRNDAARANTTTEAVRPKAGWPAGLPRGR